MKKLVQLPMLLFFVLAMFFACTKEAQMPDGKTDPQGGVISVTQDADGILHLKYKAETGAVGSRDEEECTLYEAIRFKGIEGDEPDCENDPRIYADVEFRLIKMHKQTLARTALTSYQAFFCVGGLNISWYPYPPLSDYWYAVEFKSCVLPNTCLSTYSGPFWIWDFWGDDGPGTHLDPCNSSDVGSYYKGPITTTNPDIVITQCTPVDRFISGAG